MKRFAILLLAVLALSLTACSSRDPKPSSSSEGSSSSSSSSQEEGEGSSSSSEPEEEEPEEEPIATAQDFIAKFKTGDGFETVTFAPTMFSMPIEASGYYSEDSTLSMSIYEYASAQEVADQKAAISSTGYSIKTVDGTTTQVEWVAPPHFFAGEKYIVLYCGSFSKVLSPGLRVGYVLAHKDIIPKITVGKQCTDVHTNILAQHICERYMAEYDLPAHIEDLRVLYRKKRDLMLDSLAKYLHPAVTFTHPQGGLFIWCTLPDGVDMMAYAAEAIKRGVAVVPGTAFLADESASSQSFRVNFSTPSEEAIVKGCKILGDLSREWIG